MIIIDYNCLYCNKESKKTFRFFIDNSYCKDCTKIFTLKKKKETCLEKYGVEHAFQNDEIKKKIKATCLEKYGVESVFQNLWIYKL